MPHHNTFQGIVKRHLIKMDPNLLSRKMEILYDGLVYLLRC